MTGKKFNYLGGFCFLDFVGGFLDGVSVGEDSVNSSWLKEAYNARARVTEAITEK